MSVNSSSIFVDPLDFFCSKSESSILVLASMMAAKTVLVLPLSTFVLRLAHQRWRQQRSFQTASHSDVFTYHLSVMELFWGFGFVCYVCGESFHQNVVVIVLGVVSSFLPYFGEMLFHVLTCVEQYLAVVHPVTYLALKNTRGVRIRNVSIMCVWPLCLAMSIMQIDIAASYTTVTMLSCFGFAIVVVTFCSVSVLRVLIRPGPGGGGREKVDQSKQRAFHTILAIFSVMWLWFMGLFASYFLTHVSVMSETEGCLFMGGVNWLNLPSSLVAPLLFLHRAGKRSSRCTNCDS